MQRHADGPNAELHRIWKRTPNNHALNTHYRVDNHSSEEIITHNHHISDQKSSRPNSTGSFIEKINVTSTSIMVQMCTIVDSVFVMQTKRCTK